MNLQVTSVVSCLAYIPHPNLNEFLLNTLLPTKDDVRSLPAVLSKVSTGSSLTFTWSLCLTMSTLKTR